MSRSLGALGATVTPIFVGRSSRRQLPHRRALTSRAPGAGDHRSPRAADRMPPRPVTTAPLTTPAGRGSCKVVTRRRQSHVRTRARGWSDVPSRHPPHPERVIVSASLSPRSSRRSDRGRRSTSRWQRRRLAVWPAWGPWCARVPELEEQWRAVRERNGPAVRHQLTRDVRSTSRPSQPRSTLRRRPSRSTWASPLDLDRRAPDDRGITWLQTVGDAESAERALEAGADVLIAQGGEAGGNGGRVATMVLVPEVVDLAGDVPVGAAAVASPTGAGIAARARTLAPKAPALAPGSCATTEMAIHPDWKASASAGRPTSTPSRCRTPSG